MNPDKWYLGGQRVSLGCNVIGFNSDPIPLDRGIEEGKQKGLFRNPCAALGAVWPIMVVYKK